jgi:hypothetical protein
MAIAFVAPGQNATEPPYTVTDVGANYRVLQRTVQVTNSATGEVTQQVQGYTELDAGMNYWTTDSAQPQGGWAESQDLIEITPTGVQAVHGQMKAVISGDVTSTGAITLTTASGQVFQSRPLGLYYADPFSGKVAQIALVQPGRGLLYAPNVVVFTNAFSGLNADLILVWSRNGFEQNVLLKQSPPPPETFGLSSVSSRLQMWTAMDQCPEPIEDRPALLPSGLWDHILIFPDCWFPVGSAFDFGSAPLPNPGEAATVRPISPSDKNAFPTAKSLVTIASQRVLIEEINYSDLLTAFKNLGHASLPPSNPNAVEFAARGQLVPAPPATRQDRAILLAAGGYESQGVVLDYITLNGPNTNSSYTFTNGTTYYIPGGGYFAVGMGTATFQNNACIKFGSNSWLATYGPVSFPASGTPVVFTSKDDNAYGGTITNSTGNPNYAGNPALDLYYNGTMLNVQNAIFRWAKCGVAAYANPGANNAAIYSSAFQDCQTGVYVSMPSDTLYLSGDTYCNVPTPVSDYSGTVSGSMTLVCVAMVNDPTKDSNDTDPTHDVNKNSQSEPSFILADNSQTIVAAFSDTHLGEKSLGEKAQDFSITALRSTSWARSTNGGLSFTNTQPLPPWGANLTNAWQGDAPNPVMAYDPGYPANSGGTVYLLGNCSREPTNWFGFRLWTSTNKGANFTLINTNIPGGNWGISNVDRPMIKANLSTHDVYIAGHAGGSANYGLFAAHSSNGGTNWDVCRLVDTNAQMADIAVTPAGVAYVTWVAYASSGSAYTNWIRYTWLAPGSTNWSNPRDLGITLNSQEFFGYRKGLRFNGDDTNDWFEVLPFPRTAFANGRIYIAYSDLPYPGSTTDRGDIFLAEAATNSNCSLAAPLVVRLNSRNNDSTLTDQWNPAIAVKPGGTELFIGYYSRQNDPTNNSLIMAYGAKADVANGLTNATFTCFPISPTSFPPLFNGTNSPLNMQFDPVYPPTDFLCFDQYARVVGLPPCLSGTKQDFYNSNWFQDDNTWADADSNYFYYAWCDRSRTWTGTINGQLYSRPDADVKLAKIGQ